MAQQGKKKQTGTRRKQPADKSAAVRKRSAQKPGAAANSVQAPRAAAAAQKPMLLLLAENPRPKKRRHFPLLPWKRFALWNGAGAAVLLLVWVLGGLLFMRVQIDGHTESARQSDAMLALRINQDISSYRLTVIYPDKHIQSFTLHNIGLAVNTAKTVQDIRASQHGFAQRLAWWRPVKASLHAGVNTAQLQTFIAKHASIITKPATDAHIGIDNGQVQLTDGAAGEQYGLTNAANTILSAAVRLRTAPLTLTAVALPPTVNVQALTTAKGRLEATMHQKISVKVGDETVSPSAGDIGSWLMLTPTVKGVDVSVNKDKVREYISSVAADHSAPPRSQIVDGDGSVLIAGAKGVSVTNTGDATDRLYNNLLKDSGVDVTLPATLTSFKTQQAPTTGKWIEVDLSAKRMYAYDGNTLAKTFLVSAGAAGTPTVTGHFAIYSKYRSQNMFGENTDGSGYYQPNVPYVNYFYRDYAIHGNYWRPASYFGNINSSHGCVGIPVSDGAWMYSWAPIGTPVVVHY
jgi:lipoprotein-anchoring transpeptidase ErfK/SrfK